MAVVQIAFTELDNYLKHLAENTIDTAYELDITGLDNTTFSGVLNYPFKEGTLQYILHQNSTKYVKLNESSGSVSATNIDYALTRCSNLISITGDFSTVTSAIQTFFNCSNLRTADVSGFINLTNASDMFRTCVNLTQVDISTLTKLTNASRMFYFCIKLQEVKTSDQNYESLTLANHMFYRCESLPSLDVKGFVNVQYAMNFVSGCYVLKELLNWNFNIEKLVSFANFFENCPQDLSIKFNYNTYNNFSLVRVRVDKNGNVNIKKQVVDEGSSTNIDLKTNIGNNIKFFGAIDEIAVAPEITDDQFNTMLNNRYKWSSSESTIEIADNLILWAKDSSKITTNLTNNSLTMETEDFDKIFDNEDLKII